LLFYLASKDVQLQQLRSGQKGMARRSVAMHPDFMGTNPPKSMGVFIDAWMNILYEPSVATFDDYWKVVKAEYDKLAARTISAQQMADTIVRLGNPILKTAGKPVD
jgi:hypothetical protein